MTYSSGSSSGGGDGSSYNNNNNSGGGSSSSNDSDASGSTSSSSKSLPISDAGADVSRPPLTKDDQVRLERISGTLRRSLLASNVDLSFDEMIKRRTWLLNGLAMVGVVFMVIELHLVFRGTGQVKIKTVPTELLKVAISATTLALLVVLIDYYRVLNTLWNLRWHVTKPVPLVLNVRLLIPLVIELIINAFHPLPWVGLYSIDDRIGVLMFFRLYHVIRLFRNHSRVYKERGDIRLYGALAQARVARIRQARQAQEEADRKAEEELHQRAMAESRGMWVDPNALEAKASRSRPRARSGRNSAGGGGGRSSGARSSRPGVAHGGSAAVAELDEAPALLVEVDEAEDAILKDMRYSAWMTLKVYFSEQATTFTVVLSLASYALFTYLAYITEREYQEDFNSYVVTYFSVITLTSVGYGDFSPTSSWGRFVCAFAGIAGVFLSSLVVAVLTDKLVLVPHQRFAKEWSKISKIRLLEANAAAAFIQLHWRKRAEARKGVILNFEAQTRRDQQFVTLHKALRHFRKTRRKAENELFDTTLLATFEVTERARGLGHRIKAAQRRLHLHTKTATLRFDAIESRLNQLIDLADG